MIFCFLLHCFEMSFPQKTWIKVPSLPCKATQECASTVWRGHVVTAVPTKPTTSLLRAGYTIKLCRLSNDYQRWEVLDAKWPSSYRVYWPSNLLVDAKRDLLIMTTVDFNFQEGIKDMVWRLKENTWIPVCQLDGRTCPSAIVDDLLVAAGLGRAQDQVAAYNQMSGKWTNWPDTPSRLSEAKCVLLRGELLCLGGHDNTRVSAIDPRPSSPHIWKTHACSPLERDSPGVTASQDCLYVAGGCRAPDSPFENTCQVFTAQNQWKRLAELPVPCVAPSLVVHGNHLFAIGGGTANMGDAFKFSSDVYRLPL